MILFLGNILFAVAAVAAMLSLRQSLGLAQDHDA